MNIDERLGTLADAMRDLFVAADHTFARECLADWPTDARCDASPEHRSLPVLSFLDEALDTAPPTHASVIECLREVASGVTWNQTYTKDDLGQAFLDRYGWSMVTSPDGPVVVPGVLSGFMILGPGIEYPRHNHSAEEGYLILSGEASWSIGDADWHPLPAGTFVHNPPWQVHGIRTDRGAPLIVMFLWRSGAVEKSSFKTVAKSVRG